MSKAKKIPLQKCLPRCHWNKQHGRVRKAKVSYETVEDAKLIIKKNHLTGYCVYLCPVCNKYHIGHGKAKDTKPT